MRSTLVQVLEEPSKYVAVTSKLDNSVSSNSCASCCAAITFTDEDLQLGSKLHNRPLFVSGFIREQKVNRILIDGGSVGNIMPKFAMKQLDIIIDELSSSHLIIQGFNQRDQRAIGMIRVDLTVGELKAETLFHVIDAKTSDRKSVV